ncbi:hypothetical protein BG004_000897 [Podila humilis]|nr:hypothetical protein BG004_000897 [Podila humilis]
MDHDPADGVQDMNSQPYQSTASTSRPTSQAQRTGPSKSRLLIDSDDDMDDINDIDDNIHDEEQLTMPISSLHLQLDRSAAGETSVTGLRSLGLALGASKFDPSPSGQPLDLSIMIQSPRLDLSPVLSEKEVDPDLDHITPQKDQQAASPVAGDKTTGDNNEDDDEVLALFGDDFMAEFGLETEEEFQLSQNKKPLFTKRVSLLESSDTGNTENGDDLGLDRLSISQRHRTISGAPAPITTTTSTHTTNSSTTIISALPSRFNFFDRRSMSMPSSSMTTDKSASQLEEELLEMSARQDAMLEDLIEEDAMLQEEEAGMQAFLEQQYEKMEEMSHQAGPSSSTLRATDTGKRKSAPEPGSESRLESDPRTADAMTLDGFDALLAESIALDDAMDAPMVPDATKRTRTEYTPITSLGAKSSIAGGGGFSSRRNKVVEVPKHDYTIPPSTGAFITAKDSRGRTLYLTKRVRVNGNAKESMDELVKMQEKQSLLPIPIHRMVDELDKEIRIQKQQAIYRLEQGYDNDGTMVVNEEDSQNSSERLWVDKYRPKKYTDLMGDERVNREVLSWIKEWDQCVFGRKYKKYTPEHKKQFKEFTRKPDPLGRPERKVLLLTGPPGLGKTTMAHVIARQAGYNVIEVNASDDRTGAAVKGKIEAALEIQSILGSDKPNMLIIDEIDGVSTSGGEQSFIKLLVDIASVEIGSTDDKDKRTTGTGRRTKKFTKAPLMRPIICICNDQYAPVLRPLRVIAQIYQFRKPSVRTVVTRLQQICEIEQVPSDTRAFGVLYEMTEGDMRSCLNTLQFIKNKSKSSLDQTSTSTLMSSSSSLSSQGARGLTVDTLNKATIGRKDQNKSLFSIWEELFQAPYARKTRSALKVLEEGRDGLVKDNSNTYVSKLSNFVQTNNDYEKLMQGCFENYPTMTFHDTAMSKVVENGEWLRFYDLLNSKISTNFEYELGGYVGYTLVSFHRFFAGSVRQKIEYPRKDYESFVAHKANESILQGMMVNLPAKVQRHIRKTNFATEVLSPLLRILSPFLRPVNKQLIKPEERQVLQRLVDVMIHFQMTFVQEKTEDGQFVYRLEPSIEKLGDFTSIGLKNVLTNRYTVRQLIAQEIEVELVRRAEAAKEAKLTASMVGSSSTLDSTMMASLSMAVNTSLDMDVEKVGREAVDFFGRVITVTDKDNKGKGNSNNSASAGLSLKQGKKKQTRIWYKFNEGFSNAVKAKVYISELL